jgi:hypothetical protein
MQTLSRPSSSGLSPQSRRIAIIAVFLFALSGLISGFAVGAFVRPKVSGPQTNTGPGITPVISITHTPTATTKPTVVFVGEPIIGAGDYSYSETANGTTTYTMSALIPEKGTRRPIQSTDVMCKMWLTHDGDVSKFLQKDNDALLKDINNLNQPFSDEVSGALTIMAPSQQTQACVAGGKTTWTYTISPSVQPGQYFLVVLADWKGKHYNWSWVSIQIKHQD